MEFHGRYQIPAGPEAVWTALNAPAILKAAIPGCEQVEKVSDTDFKARALVKIGPIAARFEGKVQIQELPPPSGAARAALLRGEGQGGAAGFARGESEIRLSPDGGGTLLEYTAKATVGGRLAQVGQRLIDSAAKALADEFFAKFATLVQEQAAPSAAPPSPPGPPARREEGLAPPIWVGALIGVIAILLIVFSVLL